MARNDGCGRVKPFASQRIPRALDVLGRERLAVVPLHTLVQLEGELGFALVPLPALGQIGHDGVEAVEGLLLVEKHQVVEHGHERLHRGNGRLFMDGAARRVVAMVDAQRAALLLGQGGRNAQNRNENPGDARGEHCTHDCPPIGPPRNGLEVHSSRQPHLIE
jgi:hypothetical protein